MSHSHGQSDNKGQWYIHGRLALVMAEYDGEMDRAEAAVRVEARWAALMSLP